MSDYPIRATSLASLSAAPLRIKPSRQLYPLIDPPAKIAVCLSCTKPDCIYEGRSSYKCSLIDRRKK